MAKEVLIGKDNVISNNGASHRLHKSIYWQDQSEFMSYKFFKVLILLFSMSLYADPHFHSVIEKLNVGPDLEKSPYTHAIDDDLMRIYSHELSAASLKIGRKLERKKKNSILHSIFSDENLKVRQLLSDKTWLHLSTKETARKVHKEITTHKVSKLDSNLLYDSRGDVGFCFGRATMAHYLLLKNGVKQEHIAKIFAMGKMSYKRQQWEFHMATIVKGPSNQWLVIDSLFDDVMEHEEWMNKVSQFDSRKDISHIRFYVTDPRKFQPAYSKYQVAYFEIPELKRFFKDLFSDLKL